MKQINEIKLPIGFTNENIIEAICKQGKTDKTNIKDFEIIKESIDARRGKVQLVLNVAVTFFCENAIINGLKDIVVDHNGIQVGACTDTYRPIIVGFGPSAMFCALTLAKMGLKPLVLEQGKCVQERAKDVEEFWRNGKLNQNSNVHYGEGGAGTFSDGKLNSNISNAYCKTVINEFILHGAPKEIFYKSKPHIGTDNLKSVVTSIRKEIEQLGGNVIFNAKFLDYEEINDIKKVKYENLQNGEIVSLETNRLILAIGHSPLNTFKMLKSKGITLIPKPFAMGVRIEQPQKNINLLQYGVNDARLPSADYKFVQHLGNGRSVFTFCMCPGGQVVASSSEEFGIVTNGMSCFARNSQFANSALLVNVLVSDYFKNDVLDGFYFQREYEKKAYTLGGGNYVAPCQSVSEFLGGKNEVIHNSYLPNTINQDISKCLPSFVSESLKQALPLIEKRMPTFCKNAVLIAVESRSSCPVTIKRDELFVAENQKGIYPIGEGAGYAGGIITSAVDGLKCAYAIAKEKTFKKN